MKPNRRLVIVPVLAALLLGVVSGSFPTALAQDNEDEGVTFDTEHSFYMPGETVAFMGTGLTLVAKYNVTVYRGVTMLSGIEFESTDAGIMPVGIEWSSSGAEPGTYSAILYDAAENMLVDTVHFGLWGTDKKEYTYPDVVTISGGGMYPVIPLTLNMTNGTWIPEGYPKDLSANGDGQFLDEWDFYNASTGTYTITINGTRTYDDPDEVVLLQTTIELTVTTAGKAESLLQDIEDKKKEIIETYVAEGSITDIEGSLVAKLSATAKKVQQAIDWLGTSKDKVARNMLKAAANNLKAFINHVRAQSGKHIDAEVAEDLIDQAKELLKLIQGLQEELTPSLPPGKANAQPSLQPEDDGNENHGKGKWKDNGRGKGKGKPM